MCILRSMFFKDAENKDLFNYVTDIYNNIIKQLPRLPKFMNASKLDEIIKDKDLDERVSKRVEGKNIKGRMLYKLKDNTIGNLRGDTSRTPRGNNYEAKEQMSLSLCLRLNQLNIIFTNLGKRFLSGQQYQQQQVN
ncbi:hypothetical protein CU098_003569 [Rhizopus stolonifer]|uniref:Uncharacterized protein n=1 Tax=Rhizopus stolonifer TaxID=4846 RepID=A0A367IVF3_RHIST|nr:hypothetical protein CU098_003569 [Rhizopus stolonifer]